MTVVLISNDLMGASRLEGAARAAGVEFHHSGDLEEAIDNCAAKSVRLVLVDLGTVGQDIAVVVARLRQLAGRAPAIIAFGPHVHTAALDAAKVAGCDAVLSRGQLMSQAQALVAQYSKRESTTAD
jgi:DNA-binding response OmpR family regulator